MDLGLRDRTVIVTGGTGGLGRRMVERFVEEGAYVVVTYHSAKDAAEEAVARFGDRVAAVAYDLGDPDAVGTVTEAAAARTGKIDVLVNNAVQWGMDGGMDQAFETVPDESWVRTMRANVEGALGLSRAVTPYFRAQRWGRLVHISSSIATDGMAGGEYYGAAKAALHGFSRSAAFSLSRDGDILSNVVIPGLTRTETNTHIVAAYGEAWAARAALGRLLDADEIARPVVYLASAANTGITGQAIEVSGA